MAARQRFFRLASWVLFGFLALGRGPLHAEEGPLVLPFQPAPEPPPAPIPPPGAPLPKDPPVPVVTVRVRVPASATADQDLEYHLCVENLSPAPAHHVLVRNPLPANARFVRADPEPAAREPELLWQLGTLRPGACRKIVLVLKPTGAGEVRNCARVVFEHGQCVRTRLVRPGLNLRKTGPARAFLNDTLTFQLAVTNTGAAELKDVVLTDTLPAG